MPPLLPLPLPEELTRPLWLQREERLPSELLLPVTEGARELPALALGLLLAAALALGLLLPPPAPPSPGFQALALAQLLTAREALPAPPLLPLGLPLSRSESVPTTLLLALPLELPSDRGEALLLWL